METNLVIHLIGIGGIGMSGLARMYRAKGFSVQGSDVKPSALLKELETLGIRVFVGHDAAHVRNAGLVVYSSSIAEDHVERRQALTMGIPVIHRAEALADICSGKSTIAIAGTHGKTTTTALTGTVLRDAGRDPSVVVGGVVESLGGNAYPGRGGEIVIEADESDSSFLKFSPSIEVITNIEEDHMDHFSGIEAIEEAFRSFILRMSENGVWIGCAEDARVQKLAGEALRRSVLYGFDPKSHEIAATDIRECPDGDRDVYFKVWRNGQPLGDAQLRLMGRHNVLNALAAIGVGLELGIPFPAISAALLRYEGARRRFDVRYEDHDYLVIDDYAHHPTEIQMTLAAAKALKPKRLFAFFQPHRYSRTESLFDRFAESFSAADKLIVTDIYSAGEASRAGVTGESLQQAIKRSGHANVSFVPRRELAQTLLSEVRPGDLLIALGAGDISEVAGEISDHLRQTNDSTPFSGVRGKIVRDELLSKHTTLRVGGPAEFWIEPEDHEDLQHVLLACRQNDIPVALFGWGSNVLPPDEGLKGVSLHLGSAFYKKIWNEDGRVNARAGVPNTLFIQYALENGLGGCEFLSGIPGCIGGAVAMNAGSHGRSADAIIESLTVMSPDGSIKRWAKDEVLFGYRYTDLRGHIILEASFVLPKCSQVETQKILDEYREHRSRTQDLHHPSAGCMFKNTANGSCSSGKLIDEAGLKGKTVGRAQVSEKHANFIINLGGATAADVKGLIDEVKHVVKDKTGVELETEVKIL